MRGPPRSVFLADTDPDFRESMVNHLLLSGVSNLVEASNLDDTLESLSRGTFDLVIVDYDLYRIPEVRSTVERHHRTNHSGVIVVLDDDRTQESWELGRSELILCVIKSAARRVLARWAASSPPRQP